MYFESTPSARRQRLNRRPMSLTHKIRVDHPHDRYERIAPQDRAPLNSRIPLILFV